MRKVLLTVTAVGVTAWLVCVLNEVVPAPFPHAVGWGIAVVVAVFGLLVVSLWDEGYSRYRQYRELLHLTLHKPSSFDEVWRQDRVDAYVTALLDSARSSVNKEEREEAIARAVQIIRTYDLDLGPIFALPKWMLRGFVKQRAYDLLDWEGGRELVAYMVAGKKPERFTYPKGHIQPTGVLERAPSVAK